MAQPKCDEDIRLHVPSDLKDRLFRLAEGEDRTLSDYIRHILVLHVYGHSQIFLCNHEGPDGESRGHKGNDQ